MIKAESIVEKNARKGVDVTIEGNYNEVRAEFCCIVEALLDAGMNPMELIDDCTDVITDFVSDDVETGDYIDSDITILDKED